MHKVVINTCFGGFLLSNVAQNWLQEHYNISNFKELSRHDYRLVECIEALGDKASGTFSELKIIEIEGRVYKIDEYDGNETIIEPDDINWIIINPNE